MWKEAVLFCFVLSCYPITFVEKRMNRPALETVVRIHHEIRAVACRKRINGGGMV